MSGFLIFGAWMGHKTVLVLRETWATDVIAGYNALLSDVLVDVTCPSIKYNL